MRGYDVTTSSRVQRPRGHRSILRLSQQSPRNLPPVTADARQRTAGIRLLPKTGALIEKRFQQLDQLVSCRTVSGKSKSSWAVRTCLLS